MIFLILLLLGLTFPKIHRTLTHNLRRKMKTIHKKYLVTPERKFSGKTDKK